MLEWKIPEFDYEILMLMKDTDPWAFWGYALHVFLIIAVIAYGGGSYFFQRKRVSKVKIITFVDAKERRRMVK